MAARAVWLAYGLLLALLRRAWLPLQNVAHRACFAIEVIPIASLDLFLQRFILLLQVILKVIDVHNTGNGNSIFLQDEVFAVNMHPANDLSEVDARCRQRNPVDYAFRSD